MLGRRALIAGAGALALARAATATPPATQRAWAALDLGNGRALGENAHARMPMCSSFKWLLAASVLWRVDRGRERLDRPVAFGPADLLFASPVTSAALARGERALSVGALAAAITAVSDNTAANLLLRATGGPAALTAWLREQGDRVTRCDRFEPANNLVPPGDARDTTTPAQAVADLHRPLYGTALSPASRARLLGWMLGCEVGAGRLRAGLPTGWSIAHRTGTRDREPDDGPHGPRGVVVDLGALIPPAGAPILLAACAAGFTGTVAAEEAWMAGLARRVIATLRA